MLRYFKDACIWSKIWRNAWELITQNSGISTRKISLGEGHKDFNCILFLKLIMGYINVYYSILYRVDYYEIFPQNLKIKGKKKKSGFYTFGMWLASVF